MKILAVGDIVGRSGVDKYKKEISKYVEENNIDFVIVNAENAADGMGLTEKMYKELINNKANVITMGNHTWGKRDIFGFIDDKKIIRPANYSNNNPGKGYRIYDCNGKKIAVMNLIGRVTMGVLSENPFLVAKDIIKKIKKDVDIIIIDFHAEATAEKIALSYYLNGDATIIFGTHTHVQTADEKIMENGTAYITDIGMTGPKESVIGMNIESSVKRFETSLPERYKVAEGESGLSGCIFEIDDNTNKPVKIERVNL